MKMTLRIAVLSSLIIAALILLGFRLNITGSFPEGLYLKTDRPIEKGVLVIFCPGNTELTHLAFERGYIGSGFCPGGYGYLIKKVMAAKNDKVKIAGNGVFVNGNLLPNSQPRILDKSGRDLPKLTGQELTLDDNSVLLMSDYSADSFDGRYFGITARANVISTVRPIWVR